MNQNIINFYVLANKLKNVIRTGWKEVKISSERIESVAEHIYGCFVLAIGIESEYKLGLDLLKIFKMIFSKEVYKINIDKEVTPAGKISISEEERQTLLSVISFLTDKEELIALYDEMNSKSSKEAIFVEKLCKIESDLQAKVFDLNGQFHMENAIADVKNYGEPLSSEILPQMKNASDGWILFDRRYYKDDELFTTLTEDIENFGIK